MNKEIYCIFPSLPQNIHQATLASSNAKSIGINMIRTFSQGFIKGAKETPRAFFAPAVALWRVLLITTESLVSKK
jgi:hypothetical protein